MQYGKNSIWHQSTSFSAFLFSESAAVHLPTYWPYSLFRCVIIIHASHYYANSILFKKFIKENFKKYYIDKLGISRDQDSGNT